MADILRVSVLGTMPSGEEWTINPIISIGGDFGTPVSDVEINAVATAINALTVPTGLRFNMSTSTAVTGVRVEARDLAGVLEAQAEAVRAAPIVGTGTEALPFQSATVISLRSAKAGASGRGRLYWPATGISLVPSTLRPSATDMTAFLAGAKTYLSGIVTAVDATFDGVSLVVWSRLLQQVNGVNRLQAGDIVDTQRRRRDTVIETYTSVTFP